MHDKLNIKGEWFLEWRNIDGILLGSQMLNNFITTAGKNLIAQEIENLSSPYLVLGTDTTAGEVITEGFRKAVSIITRTSNLVRFRTQMLASEANGNWEKASLFYGASSTVGTGTMFNLLVSPFSKTSNQILTIEIKITVS